MDQVENVLKELENVAQTSPEFTKVCKDAGIPPGAAVAGGLGVVLLFGVYLQGYNIIVAMVTCLYPMWKSVLVIEDGANEDINSWLCYWTVYALVQIVELFLGFILAYIPYYAIVRLVFFIWLMAPQTMGARTLYQSVFRDLLAKHKKEIQVFFDNIASQGDAALAAAKDKAADAAANIDLNKAASVAADLKAATKSD